MHDTSDIAHVTALARDALSLWDIPGDASITLINVSENFTFLVESDAADKAVLRVHRQGYHTARAIQCELDWMEALDRDNVVATPRAIPGRDGALIQSLDDAGVGGTRHMVLFDFIDGRAPDETQDLTSLFETLGRIAARCHAHAIDWVRPAPFERLVWDDAAVFGADATWGDWRAAPGVTDDIRVLLEEVERRIVSRLRDYGQAPERFNLIHADMRFANLLVTDHATRLIDFDDCGTGWLMYDFAAAVSFIEDDPRRPEFKRAWLKGYREVRPLSEADADDIDTLVMMRRMALLAWIGSHIDAPEPQALAPEFAATTARLGRDWLDSL